MPIGTFLVQFVILCSKHAMLRHQQHVENTVRPNLNHRFYTRGFFTRAHDGIGISKYFYLTRLLCTQKVEKVRFKNSLGNDPKKLRTVPGPVLRPGPLGLVWNLLDRLLGALLMTFTVLNRL